MELEVVNYIKYAKTNGLGEQEIKQNLLDAGWDAATVEQSLEHVKVEENAAHLPQPTPAGSPHSAYPNNLPKIEPKPATPAGHALAQTPPQTTAQPMVQPAAAMPAPVEAPGRLKKWLWLGSVALIVILGVGGYFLYALGYISPMRIWNKSQTAAKPKLFKNTTTLAYTDQGDNVSNSSIGLVSSSFIDGTNENSPKASGEVTLKILINDVSVNFTLDYRLVNNAIYLDLSKIPQLRDIMKTTQGQPIGWLKIDLNELQQQAAQSGQNIDLPHLKKDVGSIWEQNPIIKVDKYLGHDTIGGVTVLHFSNTLDKAALKQAYSNFLDKFAADTKQAPGGPQLSQIYATIKPQFNAIIDKIQVKQFETWVGVKDFHLYRVLFVSNAPSYGALNSISLNTPTTNSRDTQRLSHIRQLASALELYYNDNNRYPTGNSSGQPVGLVPKYITELPKTPTPPDGTCTDYYNSYWYSASPDGKNYSYTFCLGTAVGGYKAGIAKLSMNGIQDNLPCPSTPSQCVNPNAVPAQSASDQLGQQLLNSIQQMPFNAEFKYDSTYSDLGKAESVNPPDNAYDIFESLKFSPTSQSAPAGTPPNYPPGYQLPSPHAATNSAPSNYKPPLNAK